MYSSLLIVCLFLCVSICYLTSVSTQECGREGDERVTTLGKYSDLIQVCFNNNGSLEWTFVCFGSGWDENSTNVFCRRIGYIQSNGDGGKTNERIRGNLKLDISSCTGKEHSLLNCEFTTTRRPCEYVTQISTCVECSNDTQCYPGNCSTSEGSRICICETACVNGGLCFQGVCVCPPDYTGATCESYQPVSNTQNGSLVTGASVGTVLSVLFVTVSLFSIIFIMFKCTKCKKKQTSNTIRSVSRSSHQYGTLSNDPRVHTNRTVPLLAEDSFDSYRQAATASSPRYEQVARPKIEYTGSFDSIGPQASARVGIFSIPPTPGPIQTTRDTTERRSQADIPHKQTNTPSRTVLSESPQDDDLYASVITGYVQINRYNSISRRLASGIYESVEFSASGKIYVEPPRDIKSLRYCNPSFEIDKKNLIMEGQISHGQFGIVYRANHTTNQGSVKVAVKTLKDSTNQEVELGFRREALILGQFHHPNVLKLIGVVSGSPYMIVTELLKSELRELLIKLKEAELDRFLLPPLLLQFCHNIADGMTYLAEMQFVHRDLATRNVLVAKDLTCRIADFGMSRQINVDDGCYNSKGGYIPLRWSAPEAIFFKTYSEKSDVWSFGMTMYEIWSLGERPWPNSSNEEILNSLSIDSKLPPPTGCNIDVYKTMIKTWHKDKAKRPAFSEVLKMIVEIKLPPPAPKTDPALIIGNDPKLSVDLYKSLQMSCD